MPPHRVVVIGGGFGGLHVVRGLKRAPVELTLVDRHNYHLFQPLLYQVATGGLSPADIAAPLRAVFGRQANVQVLLAEAVDVDAAGRRLILRDGELPYDTLVIAAGVTHHYFGHDGWAALAPGLKTVEDATRMRARLLRAFEQAERESDAAVRRRLLTFLIVGGGPTGVELAGAIAELARYTLAGELRRVRRGEARVLLVEGAERLLPSYVAQLSAAARISLERLGVDVCTGTLVVDVDPEGATLRGSGGDERVTTHNVLWAAGVQASPFAARLAERAGARLDRAGRVIVAADCSLPNRPEIFVIGDLARFEHGGAEPLPGVAPVAIQQGRHVARSIRQRLHGRATQPFRYHNRGNLAVIGRAAAVADLGPRLRFSGYPAWLLWLFVHIMYLVEYESRVLVFIQWAFSYFTRNRRARLITEY